MPIYNPGGYVGNMDYGPYGNYGTIRYPSGTGGGGMPPVIIGAGIAAGASVVGGILQNRGQNRAIDAQTAATDKALAFSREQGDRSDVAYQERMGIWQANRQALMKHLGIDITPPSMQGPGGPPGAVPRPMGVPQVPSGARPRGMTPGMAQAKGINPMEGRTLGQLASSGGGRGAWNNWSSMGLRGGGNA